MGKLINADEAATALGITSRRLRVLCRERRIRGARFIGGRWFVPENFTVVPGARGPKAKVLRKIENVIAGLNKFERDYDEAAKKYGWQRYPPGKLPLDWKRKK